MKKLLVMDAKDYDVNLPELFRIAVRAIIFIDGKLLLLSSKFGEVKLPGGGMENGENDFETLIRETLEETGYHIIENTIREFGEVEEKRLTMEKDKIWHQINRYYFCDVEKKQEECNYSDKEIQYGFHQVLYSLDEALQINREMLNKGEVTTWNQREYTVLKLLKEYIQK